MSVPSPFRPKHTTKMKTARDRVRNEWIAERVRDARMVVADIAHHSDLSLRIAAQILQQHGDGEEEREDARILLAILDAKSPMRVRQSTNDTSDMEGRS